MSLPPDALVMARLLADTYSILPFGVVVDAGADRAVIADGPAGSQVISIRGTTNPAGWVSNFKFVGVREASHPTLGVCESGFLSGALNLWPLLLPHLTLGRRVILQGHSRGAGMVPILAGMMLIDEWAPSDCLMWEAPWCIGWEGKRLLLNAGITGSQLWHGDDPVPTIPAVPWLCPNVWPVLHFGRWRANPFDCHGMDGIIESLSAQ